jgi:glycosyltransferase involved in cell wall biosynthesis
MPTGDLELTVLMPCLNEAQTLEVCIRKARGAMDELGVAGEVLIADNGSTDGSQALAEEGGARVVDVSERGYGAALRAGIAAARGRFIVMADADDSYDLGALAPFLEQLRAGHDLVMGNRFRGGVAPGAMPPLHRYLGNPVLTFIGRLFFRSPCRDFHCGLRGFTRAAARRMDLRSRGMEFASEMVVKATVMKMNICEVPTTLQPDGRNRPPHLRSWRDGWRHLRFLLMYSPRWLFLLPGLALMLVGLVLGAVLVWRPLSIGGVTLDIHTLLYCAGMVAIGFQAVLFAVLTRVFAVTEGLLPATPFYSRLFRHVTLEAGLLTGAGLVLLGLVGSLSAVAYWSRQQLGEIDPTVTMRAVIPSVLALVLGCQTVLFSFFFSILGLRRVNTGDDKP